uniref:Syndecan n=1 Tax=Gopherus evgoodei TaxID=1825980 RepID=A0A8C4W135_9SAUR
MDRKEVLGGISKYTLCYRRSCVVLLIGGCLICCRIHPILQNLGFLFKSVIAGGLVGLLFAVFLVGFMLYRMKKKDEGSYSLDEPKQSNGGYQKPQKQEEFYA